MLAISLRPGITRNPKFLLTGPSLAIYYMKQGKYINGYQKRGYNWSMLIYPLADMRLKLFIEGRQNWLEEGLLVPAWKSKRGTITEDGSSSAAQEGGSAFHANEPPYGGIPMPPIYYRSVPMQA
jgi:hypothetical protein